MEQPMFRNEHIVRATANPIAALNPQNNNQPWHVIHVDNQAAPNGNGTAEAPFRTLADAQDPILTAGRADDPWNITYVHEGNATTTFTAYTDPFTFTADSQFLVGSGGPLTIATQPFNGEILTIGALSSGNPVLSTPGQSNITIAPNAGNVGVTIANLRSSDPASALTRVTLPENQQERCTNYPTRGHDKPSRFFNCKHWRISRSQCFDFW